jgi:NAD-dependent deacetylase
MQPEPIISPKLVTALQSARHIAVLTGAGISAESGVPTFRDAQTGLWAQYNPEELATAAAFRRNPKLVWEWYSWRRELISQARPNPAHYALVTLAGHVPAFTLITQNIDGLHQQAGSRQVIELHGNIHRAKCFRENVGVANWAPGPDVPPLCPHCHGPLRPDVVWFGEILPADALQAAVHAAQVCDLFLSIGTSALVHPAASLPLVARDYGAQVAEINLEPTPLTPDVDIAYHGRAGELLPRLVAAAWPDAAG